jgi:hypothetical protein
MIKGEVEGWPQRLEFDLMPVEHGRVQVMTRVPPADKDDLMRISNDTGFCSTRRACVCFLCAACVRILAKVRRKLNVKEGITEVMK